MLATVSGCQKWDLSQPMSLGDPQVVRVSRPVATKVLRNSLLFIVEKAEDSGGSAEACSAQLAVVTVQSQLCRCLLEQHVYCAFETRQ